jgi:hypothetical protein
MSKESNDTLPPRQSTKNAKGPADDAVDATGLGELCPGGTDCNSGSEGKSFERRTPVETEQARKAREAYEDSFERGKAAGEAYGEFFAAKEQLDKILTDKGPYGWDKAYFSPEERARAIAKWQAENYAMLPALPASSDPQTARALHEGFLEGEGASYEKAKFEARAVFLGLEILKTWLLARASSPTAVRVGAAGTGFDCAPRTAARAITEMLGIEFSEQDIISKFYLPKISIRSFDDARRLALDYFSQLGFKLAPPGGFFEGGREGYYVIIFKGGEDGGHVVFGQVTKTGIRLVDDQLGKSWISFEAAARDLKMNPYEAAAYRIKQIDLPGELK